MQTALRHRRDAAARGSARKVPRPPAELWSLGWLLLAGFLLQVVLRVAISIGRDGPTNFADETGYLANARAIAGGVPGALQMAALYRGGYSLLLLPAQWLGHRPLSEYQGVLVTNAVLRRDLAGAAVAGVVAAVAVTLAGQWLNDWLNGKSWGGRQDADLQHVLDNARTLGSLKAVAGLALGQSWYLCVATLGLVVLGLVHAATRLRAPAAPAPEGADPTVSATTPPEGGSPPMPATAPPEGGSPPATATAAGGGRSWGRRAVDGLRGAVGREAGGAVDGAGPALGGGAGGRVRGGAGGVRGRHGVRRRPGEAGPCQLVHSAGAAGAGADARADPAGDRDAGGVGGRRDPAGAGAAASGLGAAGPGGGLGGQLDRTAGGGDRGQGSCYLRHAADRALRGPGTERAAGRRLRRRRLHSRRPVWLPVAVGSRPLRALRLPPGPGSAHQVGHRRAELAAGAGGGSAQGLGPPGLPAGAVAPATLTARPGGSSAGARSARLGGLRIGVGTAAPALTAWSAEQQAQVAAFHSAPPFSRRAPGSGGGSYRDGARGRGVWSTT